LTVGRSNNGSTSIQARDSHVFVEQFEEFVCPTCTWGVAALSRSFLARDLNYILKLLYLGCQWKELPIEKNKDGRPETHYIRIYRAFRRYEAHGCFDAILRVCVAASPERIPRHQRHPRRWYDDSGEARQPRIQWAQALQRGCCCLLRSPLQCHRPFYSSPGNRNESPLLGSTATSDPHCQQVGLDLNKHCELGWGLR